MVGQSIGPFRVLRKLGAGGMGEVYLADDTRLDRKIALKCPSDTWLRSPDAPVRLHREARAAARLNHPGIAAIYDVFDLDGRPYIVMEYVPGETLSACLRSGPLPIERALRLGAAIADALAAAHAGGVVHRDLKPSNIVVTGEDSVKVLDFGVAKVSPSAGYDRSSVGLTEAGQVLGTPGYVAPEQLLGRVADERSDIDACGAVLYEMVAGRPPFGQPDSMGRALASLVEVLPPPHEVNTAVPRDVSDLIARAMAREPGDRYQTASDLRAALEQAALAMCHSPTRLLGSAPAAPERRRKWAVALAAVGVIAVAGIPLALHYYNRPATAVAAVAGGPSIIAVIPFENLSGDPALRYVGAGMAETMSAKLAGVTGLSVISRSEIHDALQRSQEVSALGRTLGASYVVTGSVQQAGERIQVTINLVRSDGQIEFGDVYEDDFTALFALQRRMAEGLSRRLMGTLTSDDQQRLARAPAASVQAVASYWRGRDLLEKPGTSSLQPAIVEFEHAIEQDASFALGHAGLADAYWRMYAQSRDKAWARKATEAIEQARTLDPEQPAVGYALATIYNGSGRTDEAIAVLRRMLEAQPSSEETHRMLGDLLAASGRIEEGRTEFDAALRLRPDYWSTYRLVGVAEMRAGNYDAAASAFQRVIELQPGFAGGYQLLGSVHHRRGDLAAAARSYEAAIARGGTPATYSNLGTVYYSQQRYKEAAAAYQKAIELRPGHALLHINLGDAYRHLSQREEASRAYERAIELFASDLSVNPRNASALSLRALCHARLGRLDRAREDAEQAVAMSPSDPDVLYQRAAVLALAGRKPDALRALSRALDRGYSAALARDDEDLASLRGSSEFESLLRARRDVAGAR